LNPPTATPSAPKQRIRTCIVTRAEATEAQLLRFVAGPDGVLAPDPAAKLPGRGVWVSPTRAAIAQAVKRGAFQRGLKASVVVPVDLADRAEAAIARRCLAALGLMRRAGALALGYDQVEQALRGGRAHGLVEASDAADDGRDKLLRLAAARVGAAGLPLVGCFSAADLGMALGRDRVVHCALLQERMAQGWAAEIGRLAGFRAIVPDSWPWRTQSPWTGELARSDADAVDAASASIAKDMEE